MILIEQSEEWMVERRYMSPETLELVLQQKLFVTWSSKLHTNPDVVIGVMN